jgi:DEAD/DEAH box helicase domain-containing protein
VDGLLQAIRAEPALADPLVHRETLAARPAVAGDLPPRLAAVRPVLAARGIQRLYSHQERALSHLADGRNVVLATPTASGKTLVYNLPVLQRALEEPAARALYLFPLKALEQDQRGQLEADVAALGPAAAEVRAAIYDGDTPTAERRRLRSHPPQVLISTPDMLHAGILPHHASWREFFRSLRFVVVDELHSYRGIFGSHVAQVLRRLDRVARFHGARPQWVTASATIANPGELAASLCGHPFEVIGDGGAPRERREVLLFRPRSSPYTLAARLFRLAVSRGLRTIAFTKARVITELMHTWVIEAEPALAARVSSYRAGFLPEERREIERRLFDGDLLGVISTSALELGIDVGGLDVCLLVGYPGSQMATWQRGGRVGRRGEALIALIAQPDALDQYLVTHPAVFFGRGFEHAVADPCNAEIADAHLPCAAAELPLRADEPWLQTPAVRKRLAALEESGALLRSASGSEWFAARRRPHRDVSLRQIGSSYAIESDEGGGGRANGTPRKRAERARGETSRGEAPTEASAGGRLVGSIGSGRVFAECHEGAIYLHRGRQYLVTHLDFEERRVRVRPVDASWYTRALSEKETEILSRDRERPAGNARLVQGRLRVTTRIHGYERRRVRGQDLLGTESLDLPPTSFETIGIWLEFPDEIPAAVERAERHPMGGIHALEHAALSLFPLFTLCDRHDVGGISYVRHPQTGRAGVFFYDGHPGGVGLAVSLFGRIEALLDATLALVEDCECEDGCPACVHSPKCGSGNRPIDKAAACQIARLLLAREPLELAAAVPAASSGAQDRRAASPPAPPAAPPRPRILYLDLETQRSAEEVGGWHNAHLMRVALAVVYDSREERFETFGEADVAALIERLARAELVVGYNVRRFDYAVLRGYTSRNLEELPTFDMLDAVHQRLGFRLPLGHLAEETLGAHKSADGLQSLAWWREGRVAEVEAYCRRDVELMRDLLRHAEEQGHLCFRTRTGERVRLPAPWKLPELIEQARAGGSSPARGARRGRVPRRQGAAQRPGLPAGSQAR